MHKYKKGDIVKGKVTGIEKYGVFLKTEDNYTGLIHISEVSNYFVKDITEFVKKDETIYSRILHIDNDKKQITLSIKNLPYNINPKYNISEKGLKFKPLEDNLELWINAKIEKIKKN